MNGVSLRKNRFKKPPATRHGEAYVASTADTQRSPCGQHILLTDGSIGHGSNLLVCRVVPAAKVTAGTLNLRYTGGRKR
jgi:hypothetical protein